MKANTTFIDWFFQLLIKPKFILCMLALGNFLAIPARFGAACFYNWKYELWFALLLLIAASALWLEKWWSYIGAAFLSGAIVYGFVYGVLKVFDVIARSPAEAEMSGTSGDWLQFMANHPEEPAQIILAAMIFCFASFYLIRLVGSHKRLVMS